MPLSPRSDEPNHIVKLPKLHKELTALTPIFDAALLGDENGLLTSLLYENIWYDLLPNVNKYDPFEHRANVLSGVHSEYVMNP